MQPYVDTPHVRSTILQEQTCFEGSMRLIVQTGTYPLLLAFQVRQYELTLDQVLDTLKYEWGPTEAA